MQTKSAPAAAQEVLSGPGAARVSVVIPSYNAAAFIAQSLESVARQTQPPHEVIVVDDGSTDATAAIARSYGAQVIMVPNGGPSAARNIGIEAATGEYIAFLDADDLWAADKLAVQMKALERFGEPAFSFTDYRMFDERGINDTGELRRHAAFRNSARKLRGSANLLLRAGRSRPVLPDSYIPPSAVIVKRTDALAVGGFDPTLRVAEDYDFHLRLLQRIPALAVMTPLVSYRRHAAQATADGVVGKMRLLDVAARVAAAPGRYPNADARYIARTGYLRYYQVGLQQARAGAFDAAVDSLGRSLRSRPTLKAALVFLAASVARSRAGHGAYVAVRELWKRCPGRPAR